MALAERFGWTWQELDDQDMSQVIPAVSAANINAALQRVNHWIDEAPKALAKGYSIPMPQDEDLRTQAKVKQAQQEQNAGR